MGVFVDHYVEYRIVHKNGMHMVVVSKEKANDRLIASTYYRDRRENWFSKLHYDDHGPIDIDIALTEAEKNEIREGLAIVSWVAEHGWYEVNAVMSTHDSPQ